MIKKTVFFTILGIFLMGPRLSLADEKGRENCRHRHAGQQQRGGGQAKPPGQQLLRHRLSPGRAPHGPQLHQPMVRTLALTQCHEADST